MSHAYVTVQWNRPKVVYDVLLVVAVAAYLYAFPILSRMGQPGITREIVQMRAYGSCAFLMLTFILLIGPLARFDTRWNAVLYNRRHFGVLMFLVAATHVYAVGSYYYNWSPLSKLEAGLSMDTSFTEGAVPYPAFGIFAIVVLLFMAITSHDFWQKMLGGASWKTLHMGVYVAYFAVVLHVAFGALQWETHPAFVAIFVLGGVAVAVSQVAASFRSNARDASEATWVDHDGERWLDAGPPADIPKNRALPVVVPGGERIAVVRAGDEVHAIHGVCAHQGGPLYEGKVIDGCLTCPWHGWQYRANDGQAPPPFVEKLPTYRVALKDGRLLVSPKPLPAGTPTEPVSIARAAVGTAEATDG